MKAPYHRLSTTFSYMRSISKLLVVLVCFTGAFFVLRVYGANFGYNIDVLVSNLGGLTYLYSTVGTIFAIFAGFVIVSESQDWTALNVASKNEVRDLHELFLWSKQLSAQLSEKIAQNIQKYLKAVVDEEWKSLREGDESAAAEVPISAFHGLLVEASKENPDIAGHLFTSLNDLLTHRAERVEFSWRPLPVILKFTVILVDAAMVGLSLFIGVRDIWLDYIFMVRIVTLGAVVLMVVDDLDNPLRPGEWCLTSEHYRRLLESIRHS
jgi:hypothetical protein